MRQSGRAWQMPLVPERYNRSPLTPEERWALERYCQIDSRTGHSKEASSARKLLVRFFHPLTEVFGLRHQERSAMYLGDVHRIMLREMSRRGTMFWDWSEQEWVDTLCPTPSLFNTKHGKKSCVHMAIMDTAYLLGGMTDLRRVGIGFQISQAAKAYFGADLMTSQWKRVFDTLVEKGYGQGSTTVGKLRQCLSMACVLNRSPLLEDLSEAVLIEAGKESDRMRQASQRIALALRHLKLLPQPPQAPRSVPGNFDRTGVAEEWYQWCMAWYDQAVDLTPTIRTQYASQILAVGRWLRKQVPEISTPEQWTEELAVRFRSELCSWTTGAYVGDRARHVLQMKGNLGAPIKPHGIDHYLCSLRRFLSDLIRHPHAPCGEPAHRITLDFDPKEVLTTPDHIRKALDAVHPRDIDLRIWAKLVIAAATLAQSDLPQGAWYPLSFYRALALVWVTSARRPNEIARLRVDCLREEWDPDMRDEDQQPVEQFISQETAAHDEPGEGQKDGPRMCYLHIPAGKNRGPFWIWIPDYVADAIAAWKRERPRSQRQLLDHKDREEVDYLFCYRDTRVGPHFINGSLIPGLCAKAGIDLEDAKGRITGHRGRSTRLTLLRRNGVGLEDLADYAGHGDTKTIRRYVHQHPLQLHRLIKAADDVSRILEGVVDVQAAANGLPALRWFLGYDANGSPMYCGNQVYHTCPHRLDCERCGMFIGGEKARLLHEGEQTLPITSKVPMTPIETCLLKGDQEGAEACRAALKQVPAPETPDLTLIFNPEGLSNHELEKLARLATAEALNKLRQALDAHTKRLAEAQQQKTGRNAIVRAQKKRMRLLEQLIAEGEQHLQERQKSQEQSLS
jgi:integrase